MIHRFIGKSVAVIPPSAFASLGYPKQLLLMFDALAIDLSQKGLQSNNSKILKNSMAEIEWLAKSGMLTLLSGLQASNEMRPSREAIERARQTLNYSSRHFAYDYERFDAFLLRKKGIDAVPIMNQCENVDLDAEVDRDEVIRLTIREFPMPSDKTPWEAIQDFKKDQEAQDKYMALRKWINKTGKSGLQYYEVKDELMGLLNEYNKSIALHKMKHQTGTLEVVVCTTAEILENLARLKLSSAMKTIFSINRQNIKLLEDERNIPGREVAYISNAIQRFS